MYHGERFNSITHVVGAALAVAASPLLIVLAVRSGDPWKVASLSVYCATLVSLYLASALYHSIRGPMKPVFLVLDYCAIYLLIAGTYTPFALVTLRGPWGWSVLGVVWSLALVGITQEIRPTRGARGRSLVIYVLMGWLGMVAAKPLIEGLTWSGFAWLAAGGFFYTGGIAFYVTDQRLRHGHGVWHLFVLAGSICHYLTMIRYVA